jgi:putative integral membrane protein (TIGR02587 family)
MSSQPDTSNKNADFLVGLARAFGGAIIFSLPLQMTMEMWELGATMQPFRLAQFLIVALPLLVGLSHYLGFEETVDLLDDLVDTFVAYAVAFVTSALLLWLMAIIEPQMPLNEVIGMIAIQAVPGSIGALLAQSQFGSKRADDQRQKERAGYFGELFFMLVGALFLNLNLAPTEEMLLIAYKMSDWHILGLLALSLLVMHAFVYVVEFRGQAEIPAGRSQIGMFFRFTLVGYAIVLLVSLYLMWTFGRTDGVALREVLFHAVVLGFPGAIGAAAARLVL